MEVVDLCSGDGWFTLQIAKVARHVAAIDIDPTLLEVAQVRLKESGLSNCSFIAGDAYDLARLSGVNRNSVFGPRGSPKIVVPSRGWACQLTIAKRPPGLSTALTAIASRGGSGTP
jgi:tRNA G37 N-methylase Trm5